MNIPFNRPAITGQELQNIQLVLAGQKMSGDGPFTRQCSGWLENNLQCSKALLTTSCTHALEMSALLLDIKTGDEVIMPSFTFVSTASAFALRGARIVFVDIRPDTLNIDERLIEEAITEKTRAIVPIHYAGVGCAMDSILNLARKYKLAVVEDAAQGVMGQYKGRYLGTIGDLGCYSFHETKNYSCGEGGSLVINNPVFNERAEIIREKGTDRSKFLRGQVDKYTWVDLGSSYLPSEFNAAFLYAQLEAAEKILDDRLMSWNLYYRNLSSCADKGYLDLPFIPDECLHNGHMFYIKVRDIFQRNNLIDFLFKQGICSLFHYVPLHSSAAGELYGRFIGEDRYTTRESERLIRLPLYYGLTHKDIDYVCKQIADFFKNQDK